MAGLVDGAVHSYSGGERLFDLRHPDVQTAVPELHVPAGRSRVLDVRTQGTVLRLLVADVQLPGEQRPAQFVVANDVGRQQA